MVPIYGESATKTASSWRFYVKSIIEESNKFIISMIQTVNVQQ